MGIRYVFLTKLAEVYYDNYIHSVPKMQMMMMMMMNFSHYTQFLSNIWQIFTNMMEAVVI